MARLGELAVLFLRLGATAFGGPAVHIAMIEQEVVARRGWLSREEFLDLLGATNLIPGPNSTEMAIHVGRRRAGWAGLLVAGGAFILPSTLITVVLAWAYGRWGRLPQAEALLVGVKPAMVAIVVQALLRLGRTALRVGSSPPQGSARGFDRLPRSGLAGVAALAAVASFLGAHELLILAVSGLLWSLAHARTIAAPLALVPIAAPALMAPVAAAPVAAGLLPLFLVFLKIGSVLFGSGYVLLAFLRADLVARLGWISEAQLLDAVAMGQVTPGPLSSTATFIGWLVAGGAGAAVATAGLFLPAFVFVAASGPLVPRLRRSPAAGAFLDGVNAAALGLMAAVTLRLGRAAVVDLPTLAILIGTAALLWRLPRINSAWLVLGAGLAGLLLHGFPLPLAGEG